MSLQCLIWRTMLGLLSHGRHRKHWQGRPFPGAPQKRIADSCRRVLTGFRACEVVRHRTYAPVIDADCQQGLEQLRGLLSHVDPRMTVGQLVGRIAQAAAAAAARRHSSATTRAGRRAGRAPEAGRHSANPSPFRRRRSRPRRNPVTLSRCRTRRSSPARLRRRRGRRAPSQPPRRRRPDRKRPTAEPLPGRSRPAPPLRRRSRTVRAARFRRRSDDRYGSGTGAAAATSIGRPDAAAIHDI